MKISNINPLLLMASAAILTGCGENAWNDKLDGFEVPPVYTTTETVNYTLTAADYKTIAGLAANKAIAEADGTTAELEAIGNNLCFATKAQARKYLPAFFAQSNFPYFTMNSGSSIKVEYAIGSGVSAETDAINAGTPELRLTKADYQEVWESETDFIEAFAPIKPAASYLPRYLRDTYDDAEAGAYAVVNYNEASENPIFGTVGGGEDPEPPTEWTMTDVIKDVKVGDQLTVRGVVTGISTRGFVVTDKAGSICCDSGSNGFNDDLITIGAQVNVTGDVTVYSRCLQVNIATGKGSYEVVGTEAYTYPTPTPYDGAAVDAACEGSGDLLAEYISLEGTISVSGNYYNLAIDGAQHTGSIYYAPDFIKSHLTDGAKVKLTGYFVCVSGGAKYFNILVTGVNGTNISKVRPMKAPAVEVPTVTRNAIYQFDGTKWAVPANTIVLQPEDYTAMGQSYGNLSGLLPNTLLPIYLDQNKPYATADDAVTVVYKYYNGSSTSYKASRFIFDGSKWGQGDLVIEQFTKSGDDWKFNPSVTLTLPAGKGQSFSATYYQACVDWVYENIDVPLGSTDIKSGIGYVTTYGNNEYYSGTSAYQNNVDLRGASARAQYPEGYEGMTDEEITEIEKKRFCTETFPGALSKLYPEAELVEGMDVLYTFTFSAYYGTSTKVYTGVWKVVGKGKFEFVSCVLDMEGEEATPFYEGSN